MLFRSQIMRTTVHDQEKANRAIQYLLADREETLVASNHKDEAREMFMPKIPLANVQPGMEREKLSVTGNFVADRESLIRRHQSLMQKRSAITRRFKRGEAGLSDQQKINEIDEIAKTLKKDIEDTKPAKRSALDFFNKATNDYADGNINGDVYAAIDTLYRQYPFVLEGLKLSIPKKERDSKTEIGRAHV